MGLRKFGFEMCFTAILYVLTREWSLLAHSSQEGATALSLLPLVIFYVYCGFIFFKQFSIACFSLKDSVVGAITGNYDTKTILE